jgi:hypothetical protein
MFYVNCDTNTVLYVQVRTYVRTYVVVTNEAHWIMTSERRLGKGHVRTYVCTYVQYQPYLCSTY